MSKNQNGQGGLSELLNGGRVKQFIQDGSERYAVLDVLKVLSESADPAGVWAEMKQREPGLSRLAERVDGVETVSRDGVIRLIQSVPSAKAERLKAWLVRTAVERLEEAENPELAVLRTRKLYEAKGYSRQWVDKRLRGVSARHELTGEWYKRGAKESDQFRALTNALMESAFGLDVEAYRRHKDLFRTNENLRDHMSDLELALVALGETAAVALHRQRESGGFEQLSQDARDAGEVVAKTRAEIERHTGRSVVEGDNHRSNNRGGWTARRRSNVKPASSGNHPGSGDLADENAKQRKTDPDQPARRGEDAAGQTRLERVGE